MICAVSSERACAGIPFIPTSFLCSGSVDKDLNHLFAAFLKLQLLSFIFYSFF
jgi:hypothetical protein